MAASNTLWSGYQRLKLKKIKEFKWTLSYWTIGNMAYIFCDIFPETMNIAHLGLGYYYWITSKDNTDGFSSGVGS